MVTSWRTSAVILLCVAAIYVVVRPWWIESFGPVAYALTVVGAAAVIGVGVAIWHAHRRRYACGHCGHTFAVTALRHLLSQNWFGRLRTRCPSCTEVGWCEVAADDD